MSLLFINENGAVVGIEGNQCVVKYKDGMRKLIPIETLENITLLGHSQLTTQCMEECLRRGIPVLFCAKGGKYFGRLQSTGHVNPFRQRQQCALYDSEFAVDFSKMIIKAKLKNQSVVLRRYEKSRDISVKDYLQKIIICKEKIDGCESVSEIMGYEGQGAKAYFGGLSKLVEDEFYFSGRSRRPPKDEFNSMLSLGYSIIMNEIYAKIESKGLNPYFGFMHRDSENHPTLASDLMEEWRAVIVDATVMSLVNGHEIMKGHFSSNVEEPGFYLNKAGIKIFIEKLEKKLQTEVKYLDYIDYPVSFRRAIALQVNQLVKAIEQKDVKQYKSILIR